MRYSKLMLAAAVLGVFGTQMAGATPTAEEAAQLGKTLTPFGAIKAGNKEGTIPEWTGGLCTPPAGYKPLKGLEAGGGPWVDPFADEKPILKITAANMAQYADKLDEGQKELLRRFPQTFFMNVYPSHRTACFPNWMYENTIKRVMNPKIVGGNVPSLSGAHAQIPFPIPKTGVEAMWNFNVKPEPILDMFFETWLTDSSGNHIYQNSQNTRMTKWYWDNSIDMLPVDKPYWALMSRVIAPAQQVGTNQLRVYYQRQDIKSGSSTWSYIPGQRRVRVAPDFSYDGVSVTSGGILLFDEINGFDGKMDKFDFKLVGRKEMYVSYNAYAFLATDTQQTLMPFHQNPNVIRYELHRMWEVEATLKPGERHVQKKKIFYIDEDSWNIVGEIGIDHADKVHHYIHFPLFQSYDKPEIRESEYFLYDFAKRMYTMIHPSKDSSGVMTGYWKVKPYPPNFFTPDSMAGMGVR